MKYFDWDRDKNEVLKENREISFDEVVDAYESGNVLDVIKNPSKKHSEQRVLVVNIRNYIYLVPFVENNEKYFLKTIFPSRKMTKKYLIKGGVNK